MRYKVIAYLSRWQQDGLQLDLGAWAEANDNPNMAGWYVKVAIENTAPSPVFFDNLVLNQLKVGQENAYYPFGLEMAGLGKEGEPDHRFKYNQGSEKTFQGEEGKMFKTEREASLGLNWDMTKFRGYDYQLGRFWQVDPLADMAPQESLSPYQYSFNNPVRYNDPNGDCPPGVNCDTNKVSGGGAQIKKRSSNR